MDNCAAHKRVEIGDWLTANPRVQVHFTPTSGSWLNLVEVWFGIIERQAIRRGTFCSVRELNTKIRTFIDNWNVDRAHPFVWTKTADQILTKANRPTLISGDGSARRPANPAGDVDSEDRARRWLRAILRITLHQQADGELRLLLLGLQDPAGAVGPHPPQGGPVRVVVMVDQHRHRGVGADVGESPQGRRPLGLDVDGAVDGGALAVGKDREDHRDDVRAATGVCGREPGHPRRSEPLACLLPRHPMKVSMASLRPTRGDAEARRRRVVSARCCM
jgi:hypothetical protein